MFRSLPAIVFALEPPHNVGLPNYSISGHDTNELMNKPLETNEVTIDVENFSKAYENQLAVDQLSFQVRAGEVYGMVGPNGAGKTTTLRALTGIISLSGGAMRVNGFDVDLNPLSVKQRTAYVPDDPQLFNDLTVHEHFAFTASVYGVEDWTAKMEKWLACFELLDKVNARASDLSRGMRQKLAISCAYLYEPAALLLDEPMTGLDPQGIRMLKNSIVEQAQRGAAIIISSHLLAMVEDICSHVMVLKQGQRQFVGSLDELKTRFAEEDTNATLEDVFFNAVS